PRPRRATDAARPGAPGPPPGAGRTVRTRCVTRESLPSARGVVGRGEAHRFDLVDLAAPDLEDVHRRQVEGLVIHLHDVAVRIVEDLELLLRHRMVEMRKAQREAGL